MIYNNLIYLLVAVLILSTYSIPDAPQLPPSYALLLFLLKGFLFHQIAFSAYRKGKIRRSQQYFAAEQKLSILAIASFAVDIYLLDLPYYISKLPLTGLFPALIDIFGMAVFFFYLGLIWSVARKSYQVVFGREHSLRSFLFSNFKINFSIILPWLVLSLLSDILQLAPIPFLHDLLASAWAEPTIFLVFFLFLAIGFPALVTRLWNCRPLPAGPVRSHIEGFCREQQLKYADIMIWPLFEGQILTAGVMGLTKRFRYLLITPALLQAMTTEEVEAVLAHEIGHVKRYHLQLYLVLFLGFGLLAQLSTYPIIYALLNSDFFYSVITQTGKKPGTALALMSTLPMLLIMVLYFRFVFGFFMRNFERQADIHAFETMHGSAPLIRVFEKIALLSGKIRDLPSWHHFSIGQRIDFLEKCQRNRAVIKRHNRKVYGALLLYCLTLAGGGFMLWKMPANILESPQLTRAETVIRQKLKEEPQNITLLQLLAEVQIVKRNYADAIRIYNETLAIDPENAESLNNLAWLLVTGEDPRYIDPPRALKLAQKAAAIDPAAHVLDTLATAYWANGMKERAAAVEKQALAADPANRDFYRRQLQKFMTEEYRPPEK